MHQLMNIDAVVRLIRSGRPLAVTGVEAALDQLPIGPWIGATMPYLKQVQGAVRTDEECHVWNRFILKLGWRDERSEVLPQRIRDGGGYPGCKIETIVDHIEYDEGRDPVADRAWDKV